jgi:bacteriophage N4 adsorption protein B
MDAGLAVVIVDTVARETAMFAATGLLIGGLDDLAVDLIYLAGRTPSAILPASPREGLRPFAIFIPAWDEAGVIGAMLNATLARLGGGDFRLYVGTYPNDPATTSAVAAVAADDARVRLVVGAAPGPTTKGDNLNVLWRALAYDTAVEGWKAGAVVLHDAEDLVDPDELRAFDLLLDRHDVVQLPVLPLIARHSRWVSAHYADEFVEIGARGQAVRETLGASLPLAGVGCAIQHELLERLAAERGGTPFDPTSLTEDYELGLALAEHGARGCFANVRTPDGRRIAVRSLFPTALGAAVRQKARWIAGIALLGWDRLGWGPQRRAGEFWMRMRDRRAPLAMVVLAAAYIALGAGALAVSLHLVLGTQPPAPPDWMIPLFMANSALLLWRLAMRGSATGIAYGWREGLRAIPRLLVSNFIGLLAARRALSSYIAVLRGATPRWDKTAHAFPAEAERGH